MNAKIKELAAAVIGDVVKWRRTIHQNPELSFKEFQTIAFIIKELSALKNVEITQPTPTSAKVIVNGAHPGKTVALRADIDALPICENSGETFSSKNADIMHACGHDANTAMLMGAVKCASEISDQLKGRLVFIFQHAEELPPGGAIELVKADVLKGVDMIFAIHCEPALPTGTIAYHNPTHSAAVTNFELTIKGRGAHGASPQDAVDPIIIGSEIVNVLQTIVSRRIAPNKVPVITVATFMANGSYNIIPPTAYLSGTMRTHHADVREKMEQEFEKTVKGITEIYGADYDLKFIRGYPVGINSQKAVDVLKQSYDKFLTPDYKLQLLPEASYGGEDFAYYQQKVDGCFAYIGSGHKDFDKKAMLHTPYFKLDENALTVGVSLHLALIYDLLV